MAQRQMTVKEYIAWTDMFSEAIKRLFQVRGTEDTPNTVANDCVQVRNAITALVEPNEAKLTIELLPAARDLVLAVEGESDVSSIFYGFNSAVISHLAQDLDTWLVENRPQGEPEYWRVSHWWKRGGNPIIAPENVFPPVTLLGSFEVTGPAAGTFTDGASVDTAQYGGAQIELKLTARASSPSTNTTVNVSCKLADGTIETRTGTIPTSANAGDVIPLGSATDRIVDVVAPSQGASPVTIVGGNEDDKFDIQTKEDRQV